MAKNLQTKTIFSHRQVDIAIAKARRERSVAFHDALSALFGWVGKGVGNVVGGHGRPATS